MFLSVLQYYYYDSSSFSNVHQFLQHWYYSKGGNNVLCGRGQAENKKQLNEDEIQKGKNDSCSWFNTIRETACFRTHYINKL
jgi:hypothetical protein